MDDKHLKSPDRCERAWRARPLPGGPGDGAPSGSTGEAAWSVHVTKLGSRDRGSALSTDAKNLKAKSLAAGRGHADAPRAGEAALNQLMDRYAGGDDAAFRALHAELAPRLHRFLLRLTGSATSADELAQEAFLRIHRGRAAFSRGGAALPWIYAVTRNVFLDHERRRKVHAAVVLDEALTQVHPDAASHRPDRVLESRRTLDVVRTTLAGLPVSQREAFILLRFEGLSVSDAAEVLGSTEASVKSRAFRAYEAIRRATRDDETSGEAKD